ncbi:unnamed protein product [Durusdinium trenchii]|uniref:Uncharacterized protein n=2 Tax=Durusdinium trenchii TaxID=1381693 RepID=A0ABP0KNG8_9DINO
MHLPVQLFCDGLTVEMDEGGPSLCMSTTMKISVPELLNVLTTWGSAHRDHLTPDARDRVGGVGPRGPTPVPEAAEPRPSVFQKKWTEFPPSAFKNSASYNDYVAQHCWTRENAGSNAIVLNDDKTLKEFQDAKFEPVPRPQRVEYTFDRWKERMAAEKAKKEESQGGSLTVKPPPNYPAPKAPPKAPPVKAVPVGANPDSFNPTAPPPGLEGKAVPQKAPPSMQ